MTSPKPRRAPSRTRAGRGRRKPLADLGQIRALAHPLRVQLLELFAARPRTTKQAALDLGQPPTRLYHHVAALERAGMIRVRETRQNRGAVEKHYEVVVNRFEVGRDVLRRGTRELARDLSAVGVTVFDQARNELTRTLAQGPPDPRFPIVAVRAGLPLSEADAKWLQLQLSRLVSAARRRASASRGKARSVRRYSLTMALLPGEPVAED